MSSSTDKKTQTRSDRRIPKLRTRGKANRERLLAQAEMLIESRGGANLRFCDVFESAHVSRGSAYRIYNGIEDLMQDLSSNSISSYADFIRNGSDEFDADSWADLSDIILSRSAEYWIETAETLKVVPRVRTNATENYRHAVRDMTIAIAEIFDRNFEIPDVPDWLSVLGMYVSLGDTIFADAVQRDGHISEMRLTEAKEICKTYLSFYLPDWLPARGASE